MPAMVGGVCMAPPGNSRLSNRYVPLMLGPSANAGAGRETMVITASNSMRIGFKAAIPLVDGMCVVPGGAECHHKNCFWRSHSH